MDALVEKIKVKGDDLTQKHIYAYGIGHILNDIVSACWFNFLSYYLIQVRCIDSTHAGIILLVAQITDAVSTPIVGILSDKTDTRWGKRTPWYIVGTILNVFGYTMLWEKCFFCGEGAEKSDKLELAYYLIFPPIMQIGWATVQVAHMALLPCISLNQKNKDKMSRIRTGFTFISQLLALGLSLIIFYFLSYDKLLQYRILAYSIQILGLIPTFLFLYYVREAALSQNIHKYYEEICNEYIIQRKKTSELRSNHEYKSEYSSGSVSPKKLIEQNTAIGFDASSSESKEKIEIQSGDISDQDVLTKTSTEPIKINWLHWMRRADFWVFLIVYMFVRLAINIT